MGLEEDNQEMRHRRTFQEVAGVNVVSITVDLGFSTNFLSTAYYTASIKQKILTSSKFKTFARERYFLRKGEDRASLVAQWLRICLSMQGTRVRALVWEGPTCRGATGPVSHNY